MESKMFNYEQIK
jgi:hypothetical protein